MAHVKANQAPAAARTAWLPRKNNTVVGGDALAGVRIVNLGDLPTKTRADRKHWEQEDQAPMVAFSGILRVVSLGENTAGLKKFHIMT